MMDPTMFNAKSTFYLIFVDVFKKNLFATLLVAKILAILTAFSC